MPMSGLKSSTLHRLLDLLMPRPCLVCGLRLAPSEAFVCAACQSTLDYTYFWEHPSENPMAGLFLGLVPRQPRAAALFHYSPRSGESAIVKTLKYDNQPSLGRDLGRLAAQMMGPSGFFSDIDALVPVPLAWQRRLKRGYNQSLMIAQGVSAETGIPILNHLIRRIRNVRSQTSLSPDERLRNVEGIFRLRRPRQAEGMHLLLIDDIVTTGATCQACIDELQNIPDSQVSVLSLGFTKRRRTI